MDLVILAGGKGSRIQRFTKNIPKPLAKFNNIIFLDYLLNYYCKYDLENIYILAGYKGDQIFKKYHNTIKNFVKIKCYVEKKTLGTGGGLFKLKKKLSKLFFVVNGDSIHDINIFELLKFKKKNHQVLSLFTSASPIKSDKKFQNLDIDQNKNIIISKTKKKNYSSGIYLFDKSIFNIKIEKENISIEDDIIYNLIQRKKIKGVKFKKKFFLDIGTPKNYRLASKKLYKNFYKPALFLDRDGTINFDSGYTHKIKGLKFNNKFINLIKKLKSKFFIFIITNQAGIAHGIYKLEDFYKLQKYIKRYFYNKYNLFINDVRFCPFHPKAKIKKYKKTSGFRKPDNLMIESIFKTWLVNRKKSLFIGDTMTDYKAAKKSKIRFLNVNKISKDFKPF